MKGAIYVLAGALLSLTPSSLKALEINIKRNPTPQEWQYFLRNSLELQKNIWEKHQQRGVVFADWSWAWRILWLKSCGLSQMQHCQGIMQDGLRDAALVVRAEAITQLGLRYRNSHNRAALDKLTQAAREPRNFRNGKPMFIHKNIKLAQRRIKGGG